VPLHGLESVLTAIEVALQAGRVSAQHVLHTLTHLKDQSRCVTASVVDTPLVLTQPPLANVLRYDSLRTDSEEVHHVP
jgi:hypothetical protein